MVELDQLSATQRVHPDALFVRWRILARLNEWDRCLTIGHALAEELPDDPRGWIALARSFRHKGRFQQAYATAIRYAREFPESDSLLYDTACYACLLGKPEEALHYLHLALAVGDPKTIKRRALADPDLQSLWPRKTPVACR